MSWKKNGWYNAGCKVKVIISLWFTTHAKHTLSLGSYKTICFVIFQSCNLQRVLGATCTLNRPGWISSLYKWWLKFSACAKSDQEFWHWVCNSENLGKMVFTESPSQSLLRPFSSITCPSSPAPRCHALPPACYLHCGGFLVPLCDSCLFPVLCVMADHILRTTENSLIGLGKKS